VPSKITGYRDLLAWQRAYELGREVYQVLNAFPKHEIYGLTSQLRRCAVSIASNIAEGYGRGTTLEYLRFLRVARGSLFELETQLSFAADFGYLDTDTHVALQTKSKSCSQLLAALIRSLETKTN
jgi:four helix bundle protein